jgi:hypothetical protein
VENERKIKPLTAQEVAETVNQALDGVQSNPCTICPKKRDCRITYKGVCKVARNLRIRILKAGRMEAVESNGGRK